MEAWMPWNRVPQPESNVFHINHKTLEQGVSKHKLFENQQIAVYIYIYSTTFYPFDHNHLNEASSNCVKGFVPHSNPTQVHSLERWNFRDCYKPIITDPFHPVQIQLFQARHIPQMTDPNISDYTAPSKHQCLEGFEQDPFARNPNPESMILSQHSRFK